MSTEQSNLAKRHEQVACWAQSETARASAAIKEAAAISFTKEVQLLSACNNNDWPEIGRLLGAGVDLNSTQDDGLTALHQACIDDDEPLVKYLIDKGADIDAQDKEGWTPLFAAISCNYFPITKYLISCGARLDMVSFDGELPLDQAGNEAIASFIKEEMLKRNLDPEEIRNRERNLMLSDVDFMKKTKDFSNFTLVDNGGSLLHIAASKDYIDVLERIIEIVSPQLLNHVDNDGWSALHVAAHWGNRKACVLLINADIDFDKETNSNQTVLEVSDDDVKPYIREEMRKARFRRQERASIKRPAESPNIEFQPSETKIICQDMKSSSPVDMPKQPNGDKHVTDITDQIVVSSNDNLTQISVSGRVNESEKSFDNNLTSTGSISKSEEDPISSQDNCNNSTLISGSVINQEDLKQVVATDISIYEDDKKSCKVTVPAISLSKTAESESQRKDKARHVRSTRRSTQGVTAEDIEEAKKKQHLPENPPIISDNIPADIDTLSSSNNSKDKKCLSNVNLQNNETDKKLRISDKPINGEYKSFKEVEPLDLSTSKLISESVDPNIATEIKVKAAAHVVNKRRTRERPPTGIIDIKDIQAACKEMPISDITTLSDTVKKKAELEIDYKILYENELKSNERLQQNLSKLRKDLEDSHEQINVLKNNCVVSKLQTQTYKIMPSLYEMKDLEKLRDENKKMKDANSALIRVISRLSHPPPKPVAGSIG